MLQSDKYMNIGFLFDLDGVLVDSEREYTRIWTEIERRYPTGKQDFALLIKGQTLTKILTDNFPEEVRDEINDLLHLLEGEMVYRYCPGAQEFLSALHCRGEKVVVVTSSDEVKMAHLYRDISDFLNYIDLVVDASKVKRSKPDPEGYLLGAESIGVNIRHCVVFEDSVQGVKAGRASGAYVVGIAGTKKRDELLPFCDVVVDSLSEVDIDSLSQLLISR